MKVKWRSFELPSRLVFDKETLTNTYGKFSIEPFERGFGITVGNGLRRVLLSSIEGAAITKVKIEGVQHEFSSIEGVVEDVTDIILNIKQILIKVKTDEEIEFSLKANQQGEVTAAAIVPDHRFEIINPDLYICTLAKDIELRMTLWAKRGRGYASAEENMRSGEQEIGIIPVDSLFSPIRRVKYFTESARVGEMTNYDRLVMEIWTDGTLHPEMAIVEAAKILRKHLNPFIQYSHLGKPMHAQIQEEASEEDAAEEQENIFPPSSEEEKDAASAEDLWKSRPIEELGLSKRPLNALIKNAILTVGELLELKESELRSLPQIGESSVKKILQVLEKNGLSLQPD